ncbi:glycosyltransferase [bacterium]|nr:glycosyltransferase [bacterium]MCI0607109.1 glycosyltransferase [bacterium]
MPSLVSFIVVNWNGFVYLEECLQSLMNQTYAPFEVLVVDNGSTDGSTEILKRFPGIEVIPNDLNRGFGPANNQALLRARGELIAFVNNDAVLEKTWLASIVVPFKNPGTGMCAGKTMSYFQRDIIDNTGHLLYWDGVNRGRGRMQKDEGQFDSIQTALLPSGCACVFRAETLREIGYFDEDFYLYGDDTEIGLRARLAGWECPFVSSAVAYHRYSGSTDQYDPMKFYFVERNRFWVALKYFPAELLILNPVFSAVRWLFHLLALLSHKGVSGEFARRRSRWQLLGLWWKAQVSAWKGLPRFLRKRRELSRKFHWSRRRFYQCFLPHRLSLRELTFTP